MVLTLFLENEWISEIIRIDVVEHEQRSEAARVPESGPCIWATHVWGTDLINLCPTSGCFRAFPERELWMC